MGGRDLLSASAAAGADEAVALADVQFSWMYFGFAVAIGTLSAVSLPLGSVLGLQWQPSSITTGVMEAFGGGALLAALSVTMVAPISLGAADASLPLEVQAEYKRQLVIVVICAIAGAICFILLDELITRKGGELRKMYGQVRYYGVTAGVKSQVEAKKLRTLQSSSIFGVLSAAKQKELAQMLKPLNFHENDVMYCKGSMMDKMYFLRKGSVELQSEPGQSFWTANPGDVLGITSIVTSSPAQLSAIAATDVECLFAPSDWVLELVNEEPALRYLILKASYAKLCVFQEVDEQLHKARKITRDQMCARFDAGIRETKTALRTNQEQLSRMSPGFAVEITKPSFESPLGIQENNGPAIVDAAKAREGSERPSDDGGFVQKKIQRLGSIRMGADPAGLDLLVDMALDGELESVHPDDVIERQVQSILYGTDEAAAIRRSLEGDREVPQRRLTVGGRSGSGTGEATEPSKGGAAEWFRRPLRKNLPPTLPLAYPQPLSPHRESNSLEMKTLTAMSSRTSLAQSQASGSENCLASGASDGEPSSKNLLPKVMSAISLAGIDTASLCSPAEVEWRAAGNTKGTAPLAVFLGILLDGIPESIVIGVHTQELIRHLETYGEDVSLAPIIPYTLIAGLFLSNFPEALAASMHMYKYGWGKLRIISMWSSIMAMTAIGAGIGYGLANNLSQSVLVGVQGFAAGAMLTMIASSMIPEAVHLCNSNFTGIAVLLGFMATNLFQLL